MMVARSSVTTSASADDIWGVWSNVSEWSKWDRDVTSSVIDGAFERGTRGTLKPTSGPSVTIEITECVARERFVTVSHLPLWTTLVFEHEITPDADNKRVITHSVTLQGCAAYLFYFILGGSIRKGLPDALEKLVATAEKRS